MKILVLNGVNLNMTGLREPGIYGSETLDMINDYIREYAAQKGIEVSFFQTNFEGECVEQIHSLPGNFDGCVLNAGAWTHYSYAIRDAISAVKVPVAEVHMSDISKREPFRRNSVISEVCVGTVKGLGKDSYLRGIDLISEC